MDKPHDNSGICGFGLLAAAFVVALGVGPPVARGEAWVQVAPLQQPRSGVAGVEYDGWVYLFGGINGGTVLDTVEAYEPAANAWMTVTVMPQPRRGHRVAKAGQLAYLLGGYDAQGNPTSDVMVYDLKFGVWYSGIAPLPDTLTDHAAAAVDDVVYAIGGQGPQSSGVEIHAFDAFTNTWTFRGALMMPRQGHTAVALGGRIYIFGGYAWIPDEPTDIVEVFDPATGAVWPLQKPMRAPRSYHGAAALNGRIYAVGSGQWAQEAPGRCFGTMDPCLWSSECGYTSYCVSTACVGGSLNGVGCDSDGYCVGGGLCEAFRGHCGVISTETCLFQEQCSSGTCLTYAGICVGGSNAGYPCSGSSQCFGGYCLGDALPAGMVVSFEPPSGDWRFHLPLQQARRDLAVVAAGGRLYAAGGTLTSTSGHTGLVERYSGYCGDGFVVSGEGCDDGNAVGGDGCSATCQVEMSWQCSGQPSLCDGFCGDAVTVGSETCDDGNQTGCDGCSVHCRLETDGCCGDGVIGAGEACDDGNPASGDGDGCSADCQIETGWSCSGAPSVCTVACGDGRVMSAEECDDGNAAAGDGCGESCVVEPGWTCEGEPSLCASVCGDGSVLGAETCDDGDVSDGDGCAADCTVEPGWTCTGEPSLCHLACGDAVLDPGEECDDGNAASGDGCADDCTVEPGWSCEGAPSLCAALGWCGNGLLDDGEACDDGNTSDSDGCANDCAVEPGWLCEGEPSVCAEEEEEDPPPTVPESKPQGCGCASDGPGDRPGQLVLWLLALALVVGRRRRARRLGRGRPTAGR